MAVAVPRAYHEENGFPALADLLEAHGGMAHALAPLLSAGPARIVDVGCGNGALLQRLCADHPETVPFGVDRHPHKIEAARRAMPRHRDHFVAACAFDVDRWWHADWAFDVMLLCPGRFLEVDAARAQPLRRRIAERVECLLLYAYSDWISACGTLEELARRAQLAGGLVRVDLPPEFRASAIQCAFFRETP
jgi:hypothetical protein